MSPRTPQGHCLPVFIDTIQQDQLVWPFLKMTIDNTSWFCFQCMDLAVQLLGLGIPGIPMVLKSLPLKWTFQGLSCWSSGSDSAPNAEGAHLIPGWGAKILHAMQHGHKINNK